MIIGGGFGGSMNVLEGDSGQVSRRHVLRHDFLLCCLQKNVVEAENKSGGLQIHTRTWVNAAEKVCVCRGGYLYGVL